MPTLIGKPLIHPYIFCKFIRRLKYNLIIPSQQNYFFLNVLEYKKWYIEKCT